MNHLKSQTLHGGVARQACFVTACLAIGLLTACDKAAPPPPRPPTVEVITVQARDVPIYREWIGVTDGDVNATIKPQVTGYLLKQNYREGDPVKKGQVLFEIDPRTFQAAVDQAAATRDQQQARHVTAAATLARVKPLAEKMPSARRILTTPPDRKPRRARRLTRRARHSIRPDSTWISPK